MTKTTILVAEAACDFVLTAGGAVLAGMMAGTVIQMPSQAVWLSAVLTGLVGAANHVRAKVSQLPKA